MRVHRGPSPGVRRKFVDDQVSARTRKKEEEQRRERRNPGKRGERVAAGWKSNDKVI